MQLFLTFLKRLGSDKSPDVRLKMAEIARDILVKQPDYNEGNTGTWGKRLQNPECAAWLRSSLLTLLDTE